MSHLKLARLQHRPYLVGQIEQAQQVTDTGARSSNSLRCLLVRQVEFTNQSLKCSCFFKRVKVLSLNVFNQCCRNGRIVVNITHDRWNFCQSCQLRSTPTPFAGDDLVALHFAVLLFERTRNDRLHDPLRFD